MTTYDPRECRDCDAPLGYPRPNAPDESFGALLWLGVALIVGGLIAWWSVVR